MKSFRRTASALLGATAALGAGFLLAIPGSSASPAAKVNSFRPGHALYDAGVKHTVTPAQVAGNATVTEVAHFTASVTDGTSHFTYSMVGKNPAKKVTNAASSIKAYLVPLDIVFPGTGDSWDPTVGDSCDTTSALARTQASPIFKSQAWTWGGTSIGRGQVTDAFQRANFWKYASPTGINPTYGVNLKLTTLPKVVVNVPLSSAAAATISCGNGLLGAVDINWLDPYIQSTVIPSLASQGVNPSDFPIFLVHNVVEYIGSTSNCCVLGYHNAVGSAGLTQTYGLSIYDNSGAFSGSSDISALSHEVGEWMDDPFTNNPTKPWGHIGQVTGCQSNLEVGDPLSGTTFTDTVGGFTYHPQQLAFFSWFYHQSPSIGVNGWYSDQGTFTTPAAACS